MLDRSDNADFGKTFIAFVAANTLKYISVGDVFLKNDLMMNGSDILRYGTLMK